LDAVGESVLFDEGDGCRTDGFGKGQDSELELAKRLLDLARLHRLGQPGADQQILYVGKRLQAGNPPRPSSCNHFRT
jgi:hypothetical protein